MDYWGLTPLIPGNVLGGVVTNASVLVGNELFPITERGKAIRLAFEQIQPTNNKSLIVFVHGRGRHPEKLRKTIIPYLSDEYNAVVLTFHWHGSFNGGIFGFPRKEAFESADAFGKVIHSIYTTREELDFGRKIPITLLSHSMGAFVLQRYSEILSSADISVPQGLFDQVVFSAAAASGKNHSRWLSQFSNSAPTHILVNRKDIMLKRAAIKTGSSRLGRAAIDPSRLANRARYIDVTQTGVNHGYFINGKKSDQNNNRALKDFFRSVLAGKDPDLGDASTDHPQIFTLR
jgi:esterase/lipase superfamily enzyme